MSTTATGRSDEDGQVGQERRRPLTCHSPGDRTGGRLDEAEPQARNGGHG
jgi:hypothetical protein